MFGSSAHIADLRAEIARLEQMLQAEQSRSQGLLDRLLERHNVAPLTDEPAKPESRPTSLLTPYGVGVDADVERGLWVAEEAAYLQHEHSFPEDQARAMAEQRWAAENNL